MRDALAPLLLPSTHPLLEYEEENVHDTEASGKRAARHPLYEMLCRLYYAVLPSRLPALVALLRASVLPRDDGVAADRVVVRALQAVPVPRAGGPQCQAVVVRTAPLCHGICACAGADSAIVFQGILRSVGLSADAVRLLLSVGQCAAAVDILRHTP